MRLGASLVLAVSLIAYVPAFAQSADGLLGATIDGLPAAGWQLSPTAARGFPRDGSRRGQGQRRRRARRLDDQRQLSVLQGPGRLRDVTGSRVLAYSPVEAGWTAPFERRLPQPNQLGWDPPGQIPLLFRPDAPCRPLNPRASLLRGPSPPRPARPS